MKPIPCLVAVVVAALPVRGQVAGSQPLAAPSESTITVDCAQSLGPLDHDFWSCSGQDQDYTLRLFDLNTQNIGSVPHGGCRWFRPHDLLKLVSVVGLETGKPTYDWTKLDHTLAVVLAADLKPLFEIMGNPSNHFQNFRDRDQLEQWQRFITDLGRHLEERFGAAEVRTWLFEAWNEPNLMEGKPNLWANPAEHHNYYDASSEGLKAADPKLVFGGPGISRVNMPYGNYLSTFLDHCDTGTNIMTGEKGVRLDFISFHRKNKPAEMVGVEVEAINHLLADHPKYKDLLMLNDEADSEVGWSANYPYRATPWYAAFMARSINEHLVRIADGASITGGQRINYRLSNDDAFWGTWDNRTQFALFRQDGRVAQIKKPSHTVRTALALLGDERRAATGVGLNDPFGVIATSRGANQVAILVYHYSDTTDATGSGKVTLKVNHLPFATGKLAVYRVDADHADTHRAWQAMGAPATPTDVQLAALRMQHELAATEIADVRGQALTRTFDLPLPGVVVIVISSDAAESSDRITKVYTEAYPSLSGHATDTMIKWNSTSWFVKTFEVLYSASAHGPFKRINGPDQIGTGFVYETPNPPSGYVKVRTIDYWDRNAGESAIVELGKN
jgi:L-iduronidase